MIFLLVFSFSVTAGVVEASRLIAPPANYVVVIDAGHGGVDGGVVGINTGVKESDLNLEMSKILGGYLERAGVDVVYTRKNKGGLYKSVAGNFKKEDFSKRRQIIEDAAPDLVISVHMNFFKAQKSRRGAQVFYNPLNGGSRGLAHALQNKLNTEINDKYAKRVFSALAGDYYIINCTGYPSVIVECGFLSNAEDEKNLTTKEYREEFCYHLFSGIMQYLFTNE